MKIDRKNYKHWLALLLSGINLVIAYFFRTFKFFKQKKIIVLYGHKLNGNLKAFYDYGISANKTNKYEIYFASMDKQYCQQLARYGYKTLRLTNLRDVIKIAQCDLIITDHGLHTLILYLKTTSIKFADVWHGIPYKGFTENHFWELKSYDEVWVSSEKMVKIYQDKFGFNEKFGFNPKNVIATGYARVDTLFDHRWSKEELLKKYDLNKYKNKKIITAAPTWKQDDEGRSIAPFGMDLDEFLQLLDDTAKKNDAIVLFRQHLNSKEPLGDTYKNIIDAPHSRFPQTEEVLYISDLLISDWSSIAFDFLPLQRPVVYLDVKPPFEHGLTLGREHRFGPVVSNAEELKEAITTYVGDVDLYRRDHSKKLKHSMDVAYGSCADGNSSARYWQRAEKLIKN